MEYLRADRTTFVSTQYLINLDPGTSLRKGRHWYRHIIAANFKKEEVRLCEVSYPKTVHRLLKRLVAWAKDWEAIECAIKRDSAIPLNWEVKFCLFIPEALRDTYNRKMATFSTWAKSMPKPDVQNLEAVLPWNYDRDRKDEE
jgi:hypothetical protein